MGLFRRTLFWAYQAGLVAFGAAYLLVRLLRGRQLPGMDERLGGVEDDGGVEPGHRPIRALQPAAARAIGAVPLRAGGTVEAEAGRAEGRGQVKRPRIVGDEERTPP